jgi:F0F1-type ATP synthase membrane subunit b/b'
MDTLLYYLSIFIISALVLLLIGLVLAYLRLVGKTMAMKEERRRESGAGILEEAQKKSEGMIEAARAKAQEIVNNAQIFSNTQAGIIQKEVQNANQLNTERYQQSLQSVQNESIRMLSSVPKDVSAALTSQLVNIRATIQSEIEKASSAAKAQVDNAYKKAEMEVESYKLQRLKQIDDSIISILEEVSRKVLAKQISHDEHEKLVMKALDEAKRQHVFFEEQFDAKDLSNQTSPSPAPDANQKATPSKAGTESPIK